MTLAHIIRGHPPIPRLWHCPVGSRVVLKPDKKPPETRDGKPLYRTIDYIQGRHAVMQDGLIVSLCHPVAESCMRFGEGGWRPKERP